MTRSRSLATSDVRRIQRDPRFQAALEARSPDPTWRSQGLCLRQDPESFFPHPAGDPDPALALCSRCPVQAPCLATALDLGDVDGVWGATTAAERRAMRRVWVDIGEDRR